MTCRKESEIEISLIRLQNFSRQYLAAWTATTATIVKWVRSRERKISVPPIKNCVHLKFLVSRILHVLQFAQRARTGSFLVTEPVR